MFNAIFSTAARGLAIQSQRVEAVAQAVASMGATDPAAGTDDAPGTPVRIGALPLGDAIESMVTLLDAELAFRMNVAVMETAADMFDSLLDAVSPHDHHK